MTDAEHFTRGDDKDEWESKVRRRTKRGRLDAVVSVRFSPEEESALRRRAEDEGTTLSALIREAALSRAAQPESASYASVARIGSYTTGGTILLDGRIRHSVPDYDPSDRIVEPV